MPLVPRYGEMWARNTENLKAIPKTECGFYILYDGSMPVYVGKGKLRSRIKRAHRSPKTNKYWDHFTWFELSNARLELAAKPHPDRPAGVKTPLFLGALLSSLKA